MAARGPGQSHLQDQVCRVCGRRLPARAAGDACSRACAARGLDDVDAALEAAIDALLAACAHDATVCPSEACRAVFGDVDAAHMERTRCAARRLVAAGRVAVLQGGREVDPSTARGPLRLRRRVVVPVPTRVGRARRSAADPESST